MLALEVTMKRRLPRFAVMLGGRSRGVAAADSGREPNMNAKGHGQCGPPGAFIKLLAKAPAASVPDVIGGPSGGLVRTGCEFE
jgi:hypothetical protein